MMKRNITEFSSAGHDYHDWLFLRSKHQTRQVSLSSTPVFLSVPLFTRSVLCPTFSETDVLIFLTYFSSILEVWCLCSRLCFHLCGPLVLFSSVSKTRRLSQSKNRFIYIWEKSFRFCRKFHKHMQTIFPFVWGDHKMGHTHTYFAHGLWCVHNMLAIINAHWML